MAQKSREEYGFLTEKLDEVNWALQGDCNDIDCNKYLYKNLLKKKFKPILKHSYSCMEKLMREKDAILRLLSQKKFKEYRFERCYVCKRLLDKLNDKNKVVMFSKKSEKNKKYYEIKLFGIHGKCESKVKTPEGWEKY